MTNQEERKARIEIASQIAAVSDAFQKAPAKQRRHLEFVLIKLTEEFRYPNPAERSQHGRIELYRELNPRMTYLERSSNRITWREYDFGHIVGITYVWPISVKAAKAYLNGGATFDWSNFGLSDFDAWSDSPTPEALYIGDVTCMPYVAADFEGIPADSSERDAFLAGRMMKKLVQHIAEYLPGVILRDGFLTTPKGDERRLPLIVSESHPEESGGKLFREFGFEYLRDQSLQLDKTGWSKGSLDLEAFRKCRMNERMEYWWRLVLGAANDNHNGRVKLRG